MPTSLLATWKKELDNKGKYPAYKRIAELINESIESGKLQPQDKLPPMRDLAAALGINYSTASRAYSEAKKRGLIDTTTGAGSFIKGKVPAVKPSLAPYEMTMNLVIEPSIPTLLEEIKDGALSSIASADLLTSIRYQDFGGSPETKQCFLGLIKRRVMNATLDRVVSCPGIHSGLVALVTQLCSNQQIICVDSLTYPGIKSIAAQLGKTLFSLERDSDGPLVNAFEDACKTYDVAALYINPTMQNPTSASISKSRREALADVALRFSIPIIEDDAYGLISHDSAPTFATLTPELTYYISGLSKCFGPGMRTGFILCPTHRKAEYTAGALRSLNVMENPITHTIVCRWINEGTLDHMIQAIKREANARQLIIKETLKTHNVSMDENAFHFWIKLPKHLGWNPSDLATKLRSLGINAVSSAAFATDNHPPQALRICFGGPSSRKECQEQMTILYEMISQPAHLTKIAF
ncbi:PLP-dependent aminotransferase family protein [Marinomonas spartinae]|uniref:aminotransferase-like domain-containing protein n=1 Tax=Marinomonas spartinae TaxID=1792290 RepID=UPI0018F16A13|nr:PLP-dependent aminotransferase family protein [Marinomonas spartinae]MBJ7556788.1 PLP-dependent aminotransferase family protein [Marinomonas spartinae]